MFKKIKTNKLFQQIKNEWNHLGLACKCIFIIGIVLLIQLIYTVLIPTTVIDSSTQIVFRTSTSSIFGFILGMTHPQQANIIPEKSSPQLTKKLQDELNKESELDIYKANNLRILFSASICIICIIVLVIADGINPIDSQEGVIEMRDLLSTTIGFLISRASRHQ